VLLALLTALYIGRPSALFLMPGAILAAAVVACDGWIIVRRHWITGSFALAGLIGYLIFLGGYMPWPLPESSPLTDPLPQASPPAGMAIYALPTGVNHRTMAFAYRGGSPWKRWESTLTAVLVRHPQGDVLIDAGLGSTIRSQLQRMPFLFRLATDLEQSRTAAEQLNAAGYDRTHLRYILLTHSHWDHVSGVPDLPGVPVLVTAAEHRFIDDRSSFTETAQDMDKSLLQDYGFEGGRYLGFERSHDLYGDGSIVIVPAPGHTPGSVVVFVTLPSSARYAFVGDLVWRHEAILEREERPWIVKTQLDQDPVAAQQSLLRVTAIATRFPQIMMVPSHDVDGYKTIPLLSGPLQ
jgi:glyoxylase-like metal-dependent hydrolase (beta-lactamase superfamily II)